MSQQDWIPTPSPATANFFEAAKQGHLALQKCDACKQWAYPPTNICSECGSTEIIWENTSGKGTVYSHGRLARQYHPRHAERLPLILAQVDIAEGLRLNTNIVGIDPSELKVGTAVMVDFETFPDGGVVPVFKPAQSE